MELKNTQRIRLIVFILTIAGLSGRPAPRWDRIPQAQGIEEQTVKNFLASIFAACGLLGQAPPAGGPPPRLVTPEVHADSSVTFRIRAPHAAKVALSLEGRPRLEMAKGADGVWSVRTPVLDPDFYGYSFNVDGAMVIDAGNPLFKVNLLNTTNMVHVPGKGLPWEEIDVSKGAVHRHFFRSAVCNDFRDFYVYTPPGYDPKGSKKYPVLYLQHGFSDDASGWTAVGRAHIILDNLIAQGKAKPMLVVMSLGYGTMELVHAPFRDPSLRKKSFDLFEQSLLKEVIPAVEKSYSVSRNQKDRALAGLSMGGAESLVVGLNNLDTFGSIGAFSSGGIPTEYAAVWPKLDAKANDKLKVFWMACGKQDGLFEANNKVDAFLKERGVKHDYVITEGAHTWLVWRRNLAAFAPLLFQ
jgi:enterochelin esterase-like enzyme